MNTEPSQKKPTRWHFGEFVLDTERRGLFRGEERLRLTPKPLETLIFLVEHQGRVVEKQELLEAVWPNVFVTEDTLVQAIREIRRVLGDDKDNPQFIQTIPRQGYRFIGPISSEAKRPTAATPPAEPLMAAATITPAVSTAPKKSYRGLGVSLLVLFALMVIAFWRWGRSMYHPPRFAHQQPILMGEFSPGKPAFSQDGKRLLYICSSHDTRGYSDIFVRELDSDQVFQPTWQENPSGDLPVFTADGEYVVYARRRREANGREQRDLWKVKSSGGEHGEYVPAASGAGFSPDGRWVAYTNHAETGDSLWLCRTESPQTKQREIVLHGYTPRWSPDGQWLAYTTSDPENNEGDLWIVDTATFTKARNLTHQPQQMYGLTWINNHTIVFASKRTGQFLLWQIPMAGGVPEQVIGGIGEYIAPSAPATGNKLIFYHSLLAKNLLLATTSSAAEVRELTKNEVHLHPRLAPSGNRLATIMRRNDKLDAHLFVTDLNTGKSESVSDRPANYPCWLDDDHLAYLSYDAKAQTTNVLVVTISTRLTVVKTSIGGEAAWLDVYPSTRKAAVVVRTGEGQEQIAIGALDQSGQWNILTSGADYENLRWLRNGRALSWNVPPPSPDSESVGIFVLEETSHTPQHIFPDGFAPVWSADGTSFYFRRKDDFTRKDARAGLYRYDMQQKKATPVRFWQEVAYFDLVGERLVFARSDARGQTYLMERVE